MHGDAGRRIEQREGRGRAGRPGEHALRLGDDARATTLARRHGQTAGDVAADVEHRRAQVFGQRPAHGIAHIVGT